MTPIPTAVRKIMNEDPFYKHCAFYGHDGHICGGRVTMDHTVVFGGKQLQIAWAIVPICAHGHGVDEYQDDSSINKEMRLWVSLNRATEAELLQISKVENYTRTRNRLNDKYGVYQRVVPDPFEKKNATTETDSKRRWHLVTKREEEMIDKIRQFQRTALGINDMPRQVIYSSIEYRYLEIRDQLMKGDPELYKKLGFDK